jgi:hypothetical protein
VLLPRLYSVIIFNFPLYNYIVGLCIEVSLQRELGGYKIANKPIVKDFISMKQQLSFHLIVRQRGTQSVGRYNPVYQSRCKILLRTPKNAILRPMQPVADIAPQPAMPHENTAVASGRCLTLFWGSRFYFVAKETESHFKRKTLEFRIVPSSCDSLSYTNIQIVFVIVEIQVTYQCLVFFN